MAFRIPSIQIIRGLRNTTSTQSILSRPFSTTHTRLSTRPKIYLFTKENCGLCEEAKIELNELKKRIPFDVEEINIYDPKYEKDWSHYMFDIPILHIAKSGQELDKSEFIMQHFVDVGKLTEELTLDKSSTANATVLPTKV